MVSACGLGCGVEPVGARAAGILKNNFPAISLHISIRVNILDQSNNYVHKYHLDQDEWTINHLYSRYIHCTFPCVTVFTST